VILNSKFRYRINYQIRCPEVRVSKDNQQLGIMNSEAARNMAFDQGLDLIEINARSNPPICIIADFGKLKYESKIKEKEMARKQREAVQDVKEIRLTPTIADHDVSYKAKNIQKFLEDGKKVQIIMKFSPRELHHKDIGMNTINAVIEMFAATAVVEQLPRFAGRRLSCLLSPKG
jgi:translation initiation factor IF-3